MKNKKLHHKDFGETFPEPGITPDDAWKQMHQLLTEHHLTDTSKKDERKRPLLLLLLFLLITSGMVVYVSLYRNAEDKKEISVKPSVAKTGNENTIGANADSLQTKRLLPAGIGLPAGNTAKRIRVKREGSLNKYLTVKQPANGFVSHKAIKNDTSLNNKNVNVPAASGTETADSSSIQKNIQPVTTYSNNKNILPAAFSKGARQQAKQHNFHFGLGLHINFSLKDNSHYFDAYHGGGKQYYSLLIPSLWAGFDIRNKHNISLQVNAYKQLVAGSKIINIEKPFIASVEPDVVTRLVKNSGIAIGLQYSYRFTNKFSVSAGVDYTHQYKPLYLQQSVEGFSGNIMSQKIYAPAKHDADFNFVKPSYISWKASVNYRYKKVVIGAGLSQPFSSLSANPEFSVRPLNGEVYLHYRLK